MTYAELVAVTGRLKDGSRVATLKDILQGSAAVLSDGGADKKLAVELKHSPNWRATVDGVCKIFENEPKLLANVSLIFSFSQPIMAQIAPRVRALAATRAGEFETLGHTLPLPKFMQLTSLPPTKSERDTSTTGSRGIPSAGTSTSMGSAFETPQSNSVKAGVRDRSDSGASPSTDATGECDDCASASPSTVATTETPMSAASSASASASNVNDSSQCEHQPEWWEIAADVLSEFDHEQESENPALPAALASALGQTDEKSTAHRLDGVYLQYSPRMTTDDILKAKLRSLSKQCVVGVWHQTDKSLRTPAANTPFGRDGAKANGASGGTGGASQYGPSAYQSDQLAQVRALTELGVSFVNTDWPREFMRGEGEGECDRVRGNVDTSFRDDDGHLRR